MGHSQAEKLASRRRVIRAAATRMRERGLEGIGVADLMKEAGLTHGGFYRHFANRDDLVAQALASALAEGEDRIEAAIGQSKSPRSEVVSQYLGEAHRDNVGSGCAVAALAGDVARGTPQTRAVFTRQIRRQVELMQRISAAGREADRAEALNTMSLMAGALTLSRAVDDPVLSSEILAAAREALTRGLESRAASPRAARVDAPDAS